MVAHTPRSKNEQEGPSVEFVRAQSDSHLAKRYDPATYKDGYGDFAHEFPGTHLRLTRGVLNATIGWPWPGNDAGLYELLSHYVASGDEAPVEFLFKIINDGLAQKGRETWKPRDFAMVAAEVYDVAEAREDAEADRIVVPVSGRRKTQDTFIVEKICNTVHCSRSRGYAILRYGSAVPNQRIALAKAFSNDPDRRTPRHWEPQFAGRTWGRQSAYSFERYVLDRIDAFEGGNIGAALAVLIPRFEEGWSLPADDLESLLRAIRKQALPISAEATLDLWTRYTAWKRSRY